MVDNITTIIRGSCTILLLSFIVLIIIGITVGIVVYRIYKKSRFWIKQPVFHLYDIHHWLGWAVVRPDQLIMNELPKVNEFVDLDNYEIFIERNGTELQTINGATINPTSISLYTMMNQFIQTHYLNTAEATYLPRLQTFIDNMERNDTVRKGSHTVFSYPSLLGIMYNVQFTNGIQDDIKVPVGTMTSIPLPIMYKSVNFNVYYVDNLTVDCGYRNQGIAPRIIQTHEYIQRRLVNNWQSLPPIKGSLFKREGDLTGIVPLVKYMSYCYVFKLKERTDKNDGPADSARHTIHDWLDCYGSEFDCIIGHNVGTNDSSISPYYTQITDTETIHCNIPCYSIQTIASNRDGIVNTSTNPSLQFTELISSLERKCNELGLDEIRINIEGIGNGELIKSEMETNSQFNLYGITPMAYFLYNHAVLPIYPSSFYFVV
jgi:hypothetical protein